MKKKKYSLSWLEGFLMDACDILRGKLRFTINSPSIRHGLFTVFFTVLLA